MKRVLSTLALALAFSFIGLAQPQWNVELGAYWQKGQYASEGNTVKDSFLGVSLLFEVDPFFPESLYLSTGVEASLGLSKDGNVPDYRFEIPLRVAWMWEPSPRFSIGPYAGVYGVWNLMVVPDDETAYNTLQGGFSAGVSIRFGALDLYGGYWRDFLPFRKGGSPFSGWRVTLAYFM